MLESSDRRENLILASTVYNIYVWKAFTWKVFTWEVDFRGAASEVLNV